MMCVGAAVRHVVWERESQNAMVTGEISQH